MDKDIFMKALDCQDIKTINTFLKTTPKPGWADGNFVIDCFMDVCARGHLAVLNSFLKHGNIGRHVKNGGLHRAARYGHLDVIKRLVPLCDPKACDSMALREAAECGHLSVVEYLLPISDRFLNDFFVTLVYALKETRNGVTANASTKFEFL